MPAGFFVKIVKFESNLCKTTVNRDFDNHEEKTKNHCHGLTLVWLIWSQLNFGRSHHKKNSSECSKTLKDTQV